MINLFRKKEMSFCFENKLLYQYRKLFWKIKLAVWVVQSYRVARLFSQIIDVFLLLKKMHITEYYICKITNSISRYISNNYLSTLQRIKFSVFDVKKIAIYLIVNSEHIRTTSIISSFFTPIETLFSGTNNQRISSVFHKKSLISPFTVFVYLYIVHGFKWWWFFIKFLH